MNEHERCPMCETCGVKIPAQGEVALAFPSSGCLVYTFGEYY